MARRQQNGTRPDGGGGGGGGSAPAVTCDLPTSRCASRLLTKCASSLLGSERQQNVFERRKEKKSATHNNIFRRVFVRAIVFWWSEFSFPNRGARDVIGSRLAIGRPKGLQEHTADRE